MTKKEKKLIADLNKDMPTEEIRQDIIDTQREIATMTREEKGFRLLGDRLSMMRAGSRSEGIKERRQFVKNLKAILEVRGEL